MYYGGIGSIYDPSKYPQGVPNPYVPRVHAWGNDSWLPQGTRYHGPNYVRPMFGKPWQSRPLMGIGQDDEAGRDVAMMVGLAFGVGILAVAVWALR
jgi:hypothetical protein